VISHRFSKKENALTVGGSWIVDNITTVKARVDDRGKIMMLLQYGIKSKSCLVNLTPNPLTRFLELD
jgi:voltage-dependent anion channel protein 2